MTLLVVIEDKLYKNFNNQSVITFENNSNFKNVLSKQISNCIAVTKSSYKQHKKSIDKKFFKNSSKRVIYINKFFELNNFITQTEHLI